MKKRIIIMLTTGLIGGFLGNLLYDVLSRPDGYLYLDKDTKSIYAQLNEDPDEYKNNSKLIFIYKR